ncbi:MAG: lipase chaperone [Cellvibrionaceae bacterium]
MGNQKKVIVIGAVTLVSIVVLSFFFLPSFIQDKKIAGIKNYVSGGESNTNSIAEKWKWDNFEDKDINTAIRKAEEREEKGTDEAEEKLFEFDVVVVYSALAAVGIDDNGDVIIDSKALDALEDAFSKLPEELTGTELEELLQLIKTGLPGAAGEQTAEIIDQFQRFKIAERDFNAVMPEPKNASEALEIFNKKVALRESILGFDVANKLFSQEQAQSRHMLELMAISGDISLSDEEKKTRIKTLNSENNSLTNNYSMKNPRDDEMVENNVLILRQQGTSEEKISAYRFEHLGEEKASLLMKQEEAEKKEKHLWAQRYELFSKEKKTILSAELPEDDQKFQIEALLKQYYDESELDAARAYDRSQGNPQSNN